MPPSLQASPPTLRRPPAPARNSVPAYTFEQLVTQHKASLLDAAGQFTEADDAAFKRHLSVAAREIAVRKRPRTLAATLPLVAGTDLYDAPADILGIKVADWGMARRAQPWNYPRGPLPVLVLWEAYPGASPRLRLSPAPCQSQLDAFGTSMPYYYLAAHSLPDAGYTSITDRELNLLLLRAKVEAMRELAIRSSMKPVTLRGGQGMGDAVMSKNMTPPALYEQFLKEYEATP